MRRLDDQLLPHGAARVVVDVVNLVEHHVADSVHASRLVVQNVAQDLRRHHQHRRTVIERVLTGDQADAVLTETRAEVVILLVAERFQWGRVHDVGCIGDGPSQRRGRVKAAPDHVIRNDGLAARCRRADEDAAGALELLDCLALKLVEREGERRLVGGDEIPRQRLEVRRGSTRNGSRSRAPRRGRRRTAAPSGTSRRRGGCPSSRTRSR